MPSQLLQSGEALIEGDLEVEVEVSKVYDHVVRPPLSPVGVVEETNVGGSDHHCPKLISAVPRLGGRLQAFWRAWESQGDPWVPVALREGYRIPFLSQPPLLARPPSQIISTNPKKVLALSQAVVEIKAKGAVEVVALPASPGFYSHVFLV